MKHMNLGIRHAYCKSRLGVGSRQNVALDNLICEALEKDGKPRPIALSHKRWVNANLDYVYAQGRIAKSLEKAEQVKPLVRSNTEIVANLREYYKDDVKSDKFLETYDWRKLRMEALKKYGTKCQCCGASPQTGAVLNVDHIKPRKLFPELAMDINNLQILCHECNHGKGNWDQTDWRS